MKNTTSVLPILLVILMTGISLFSSAQIKNPASGVQSESVYKGTDRKLKYKTTPSIIQQIINVEQDRTIKRANILLNEKPRTVTASSSPRAFRFVIPGSGEIEISSESSTINLAGENFTYYGQNHPNRYGYESALGPITGDRMSNAVLAHIKDHNHFVLMAQAATNGQYVQSHFLRTGSSFRFSFPIDQLRIGPVVASLPFHSPWRVVVISPENPSRIVESYLMENLNPPTDPAYLKADGSIKDWVKPGRVMWDFIAKDGDKPRMWIDAVAEMGWEYYMADAGFAKKWGGNDTVPAVVKYADIKKVNGIGWAHTREFDTREKAVETMNRYAGWGLKGAKIDFFDQNTLSENPKDWKDYQDESKELIVIWTDNQFKVKFKRSAFI